MSTTDLDPLPPRGPVHLHTLTVAQRTQLRGQLHPFGHSDVVITPDGRRHRLGNITWETDLVTGEIVKVAAWSLSDDTWLDLLAVPVVTDASVCRFLDLSLSHLPQAFGSADVIGLDNLPGVIAYPKSDGWFMWVRGDLDPTWDRHNKPAEVTVPAEVHAIQRYARVNGCDWVLFDADGPVNADLPTWQW